MLRLVCDRCKKVINSLNDKPSRLTIKSIYNRKDKDVDLCSDCTKLFNTFMLNEEPDDNDEPVAMPIDEDWFKCPRCHAHYAFEVVADPDDRIQRIRILRRTPDYLVKEDYINPPFVNFNCSMCNQLLSVPESVSKEVNLNGYQTLL